MNRFKSKKAIWWSVGVFLVLGGFFVAAVILPSAGPPYGSDSPNLDLPSMRNTPENPGTHKLDVEVQEEDDDAKE